jgi:hypothetical protein
MGLGYPTVMPAKASIKFFSGFPPQARGNDARG